MDEVFVFKPPQRQGLVLHILAILVLVPVSGWNLGQALQSVIGPDFLLHLLLFLLGAVLVPLLAYRAYALYKASYRIERDGIRLSWGLRSEDIPMDAVLWVRSPEEMGAGLLSLDGGPGTMQVEPSRNLLLPWLRWPGAVLGTRQLPGFGPVEYMAASSSRLLFIATPSGLFAISPADPAAFRQVYQRFTEMVPLTPLPARSVYPAFLLARVWKEPFARTLLLAGIFLSLVLLGWVSLTAPAHTQISLGFNPNGSLREHVPGVQLLLLPLVNAFFFLTDLLLGLYFYRRGDSQLPTISLRPGVLLPIGQVLAYLLWVSGIVTALIFIVALAFVLAAQ